VKEFYEAHRLWALAQTYRETLQVDESTAVAHSAVRDRAADPRF